jgi:endonuclease/exonuclease/phosphatase family metal-dependent hydrolase
VTRPAPGPDQPPIPVRLATFNIHHGVGEDQRLDLPRLAKVLAALDADVLCLQEVDRYYGDRSEDVDQALLLSRALDMQLAWGPAIDEPGPPGRPRQYGNALLSRLPILVSDVHPLPGAGEPRSALRTMLELDGGTLWVTVTHLSTGPAAERAAQAAALAALHTDTMGAGVLAGDFNARPDAAELDVLRERFTDAWEAAGWRADRARLLVLAPRHRRHLPGPLTEPAHRPGVALRRGHGHRGPRGARRGGLGPPAARRRPGGRIRRLSPATMAIVALIRRYS